MTIHPRTPSCRRSPGGRLSLVGRVAVIVLGLAAALGVSGGCAYYNTFYNAKQAYKEGEEAGKDVDQRSWPTTAQRPKYSLCISKCELLLEEHPNSNHVDDALFLMAKAQFRLRDYRKAIRNFEHVQANFPNSKFLEETLFLESLSYLELGEEQSSLDRLRRLRESYPNSKYSVESLYRLGDTYAENGQSEQALDYYIEFLSNHSGHREAGRVRFDAGNLFMELGRYDEAEVLFEAVASGNATRELKFEAKLNRAESLNELGRSEEASELLGKISKEATLYDKRGETLVLEGKIELGLGHREDGIEVLESAATEFQRGPVETQARYEIAEYLLATDGPNNPQIVGQLQTALDAGPRGDYADSVRTLRQQMGKYRQYKGSLAEPDSNSGNDAFRLAELLYLDLGRPQDSLTYYQMVLDDYPDSPMAPRAAYAIGYIQRDVYQDTAASDAAFAVLDERYPDSLQARARGGEIFLDARAPSATLASVAAAPGGQVTSPTTSIRPPIPGGDIPFQRSRRVLRSGGPGARTPAG